METLADFVTATLSDFAQAAALAGTKINANEIRIDIGLAPHKPKGLPHGKMAVYCFFLRGKALKVGVAGPNSDARFRSQHYNPTSAQSNLAKSLLAYPSKIGIAPLPQNVVGEWIKNHTDRVDLLIAQEYGKPMLLQLESFLHVRWEPIFEGRMGDKSP